ncbi:MAG: hypothetical protein KME45_30500 [Stenomitos rutilans HA7619-LM2]|jgi:hypothetical protein|nr:hypothetical protein [Stenomitos rutilans HA7619-LM2]
MEETVEIQELKLLIKETMREVLREERLMLCKILMPYVDDAEQAELEAEFGSPTDYSEDEAIDMTAWVKHGNQVP